MTLDIIVTIAIVTIMTTTRNGRGGVEGSDWAAWAYGKSVSEMTDAEVRSHAQVAWNTNDGEELRRFRAECSRRGLVSP